MEKVSWCPENPDHGHKIDLGVPLKTAEGLSWLYLEDEKRRYQKYQLFNCEYCHSSVAGNHTFVTWEEMPADYRRIFRRS